MMNKILLILFAVFLLVSIGYSQDAPEDSTAHFKFMLWAEDANPGHDAINNNWDVIDSAIYHAERYLIATIRHPADDYGTVDSLIELIPAGFLADSITVTRITVENSTDTLEVSGDLMYADDFAAQTDSVIINDFNTTSGARIDNTITAAGIPAGKCVYLNYRAIPDTALVSFTIGVRYHR
jgi:hypothetical protein